MAAPKGNISYYQHVPNRSTPLDDPFYLGPDRKTPLSTPGRVSEAHPPPGENADGGTTTATNPYMFGNAPHHERSSSGVMLPSSPASKRDSTIHNSSERSLVPLRASGTFLNAGAAPFQPKFKSPEETIEEANKQSAAHKLRIQKLYSAEELSPPAATGYQKLGQASNKIQPRPPLLLPFRGIGYNTPPNENRHSSLALEKRNLSHSDEPSFYQLHTSPQHTGSPSQRGKSWSYRAPKSQRQVFHNNHNSRTQHPPTSQLFSSMPQLPHYSSQSPSQSALTKSSSMHRNRNTEKGMLNRANNQDSFQGEQNGDTSQPTMFDHYTPTASVAPQNHTAPQPQINPYSQDGNTMGSGTYFPGSTNYPQQVLGP